MDLALEDHPIHKNQHGFQRGLSTETAISKTVNIEKHINSGREVLGVFLDIQAAFDTICRKHIKASLLKHGADPDLAEFYDNYITQTSYNHNWRVHTYNHGRDRLSTRRRLLSKILDHCLQ